MEQEILKSLINEKRYDYKCFDELKRFITSNSEFKEIVKRGLLEGKITGFDESIWEKIDSQNIRIIDSFESIFKEGYNIGGCTTTSRQLSFSFDGCYICGGKLPILEGTKNSPDGRHTWIYWNDKVIDTTLMLVIDKDYVPLFGYKESNRYDPMEDPLYVSSKDFALDENLRKKD